jgi:hypothetical protein
LLFYGESIDDLIAVTNLRNATLSYWLRILPACLGFAD